MDTPHDSTSTAASHQPAFVRSRLPIAAGATIGAALIGNIIVWAIARGILDDTDDFMPMASVGPTIFATVIYLLGAVGLFWVVVRRSAQPQRRWMQIATIGLVLSFVPLLGLTQDDNASIGALIALGVMHVVAYIPVVTLLPSLARRR